MFHEKIICFAFIYRFVFTLNTRLSSQEKTGTIIVKLTGFNNDKGKAMVWLWDTKENYEKPEAAFRKAKDEIKDNKTEIVFTDMPFGTYAIKAFHDENDNNEFDLSLFNIPTEQYGFSNNAKGKFGPPKWEKAQFAFDKAEVIIEIVVKDVRENMER
jgi:uncharacterized protein (DUF2141 family)